MNSGALSIFAILALTSFSAPAITRTWDGGGGTALFSTAANWNPDGAPANGDDLIFPAAAPATVTNDLTGRTFGSLTFTAGVTLAGNPFTLTNGLASSLSDLTCAGSLKNLERISAACGDDPGRGRLREV